MKKSYYIMLIGIIIALIGEIGMGFYWITGTEMTLDRPFLQVMNLGLAMPRIFGAMAFIGIIIMIVAYVLPRDNTKEER